MHKSGFEARAPGRDGVYDTGLFEYNREDMTIEEMERRAKEGHWNDGDLFAIFRDALGGTHAQYSHIDDFADVALQQLIRSRRGYENVPIDRETILYLVGILMISRIHGYEFEEFVDFRDHLGNQIFDLRKLCEWIGSNEEFFLTDAEAVMEMDDTPIEDIEAQYDSMPVTS